MGKMYKLVLLIISTMAMNSLSAIREAQGEKINLEFYVHEVIRGDNPTTIKMIQPSDRYPTEFGAIVMQDEPLTLGPDPKSKLIGKAQGFFGLGQISQVTPIMALSFVFTDGPYRGSSISVLGRNVAFDPQREMPIIGGTGAFRLARGYGVFHTNQFNSTTQNAILHYNMKIIL